MLQFRFYRHDFLYSYCILNNHVGKAIGIADKGSALGFTDQCRAYSLHVASLKSVVRGRNNALTQNAPLRQPFRPCQDASLATPTSLSCLASQKVLSGNSAINQTKPGKLSPSFNIITMLVVSKDTVNKVCLTYFCLPRAGSNTRQ